MSRVYCDHKRQGDYIHGWWVCGDCYERLAEPPKKYITETIRAEDGRNFERQQVNIPRQAKSGSVTLSEFVGIMARRLMMKALFEKDDAITYALEILRMLEIKFGDDDYSWDACGAWDFVNDDMEYWDCDSQPSNG